MGRPLYSTQVRITALNNKSVNSVNKNLTGIIPAGDRLSVFIYSKENTISKIINMTISIKADTLTPATSGNYSMYLKNVAGNNEASYGILSQDYNKSLALQFNTASVYSSVGPTDLNILQKNILNQTFDEVNELIFEIINNTDADMDLSQGSNYIKLTFIEEVVE